MNTQILWLVFTGFSVLEMIAEGRSVLGGKLIRWPINIGLLLICAAVSSIIPSLLVLTTLIVGNYQNGLLAMLGNNFWLQVAAWLMSSTFIGYWVHRAFHTLPFLWRFHKVHHSDTKLDATTGFRHHPGEMIISYLFILGPLLVLRPTPEAILIVAFFEAIVDMFTHSNLPLNSSIDRILGTVLVTPRIHNFHHSTYQPETDSNYSGAFVIWDKMFGSFTDKDKRDPSEFRFGLDDVPKAEAEDLVKALVSPFR